MEKQQMETKLWAIADELRGNMDANEYKNYILGFIFYRFLSEKVEKYSKEALEGDDISFENIHEDPELLNELKEDCLDSLGYFLEPQYLFKNLIEKSSKGESIIELLDKGLKYIENSSLGHESEKKFIHIFDDVDLQSPKLGRTVEDKNRLITNVLRHLAEINFDEKRDILGDAYEYLIAMFASSAGKKAGEFYTPQEVSKVLAKIVTLGKDRLKSVYDPTCGSGSLLLRVANERKISYFYGQELNQTTYNLAIMNMILHGVKPNDFYLEQGDTLEDDRHFDKKFDAIVANPPFSAKWSASSAFLDDERFGEYGKLAPKTKADFAFVQHMLYHLNGTGTMATVLPHGVLFRGAAEGTIREYLLKEKNYLDAVIGLPANIFYGTSIPTVILVFKKNRENKDNILFIDASNDFEKVKTQNRLRDEDIEKIVRTYEKREDIEKYSRVVTMEEIAENDYNLNIPRYVDTFEEEEKIDLDAVVKEIESIDEEMKEIDETIKRFCKELGIKAPVK